MSALVVGYGERGLKVCKDYYSSMDEAIRQNDSEETYPLSALAALPFYREREVQEGEESAFEPAVIMMSQEREWIDCSTAGSTRPSESGDNPTVHSVGCTPPSGSTPPATDKTVPVKRSDLPAPPSESKKSPSYEIDGESRVILRTCSRPRWESEEMYAETLRRHLECSPQTVSAFHLLVDKADQTDIDLLDPILTECPKSGLTFHIFGRLTSLSAESVSDHRDVMTFLACLTDALRELKSRSAKLVIPRVITDDDLNPNKVVSSMVLDGITIPYRHLRTPVHSVIDSLRPGFSPLADFRLFWEQNGMSSVVTYNTAVGPAEAKHELPLNRYFHTHICRGTKRLYEGREGKNQTSFREDYLIRSNANSASPVWQRASYHLECLGGGTNRLGTSRAEAMGINTQTLSVEPSSSYYVSDGIAVLTSLRMNTNFIDRKEREEWDDRKETLEVAREDVLGLET